MVEMLEQYRHLLMQVSDCPLPDPRAILPEPRHELITEHFALWMTSATDLPAIEEEGRRWTYPELANSARALAHALLAQEVERGNVVAVAGKPGFGLIASMAGALLSGGVLLTLDRHLPRRRQQIMLEQADAKHLLYIGAMRPEDAWMREFVTVIRVDPGSGQPAQQPAKGLTPEEVDLPDVTPDDAAYLFFTSGTTGVPKGVLGSHKGLAHFLNWQRQAFAIGRADRSAQLTGISFDVVLRDIFTPLISGATLCVPAEDDRLDPARLLSWMERERISMLHTVPSLAQSWLHRVPSGVSLRTLRWAFFAGEPLTDTLVRRWRQAFPEAGEIVNLYGPTETTLAKCFFRVPADPAPGVQPIGSPLPETQALVLGENNRLCGIGEPGEIVLRTPFRSFGYINASEENQRRFIRNPFRDDENDLLYVTGDRGRYRPDGTLDILGRVDNQVKLRGVRIELGGIERLLAAHPAVWDAVVLVREDLPGDARLVAYVTAAPGYTLTTRDLLDHLRQSVPDTMVPSAIVVLGALPLTANGKVDRSALPLPAGLQAETEVAYLAPRYELERLISTIWEEVLRIKKVSVNSNFFDLGGHSLLVVEVQSKLRELLDRDVAVAELFRYPTISTLARHLSWELADPPPRQQDQGRARLRKELVRQRRQIAKSF